MNCVEANINITVIQGGTFYKQMRWETGDPPVPVDLTGYSAKMMIRKKITDPTVLFSLTSKAEPWTEDVASGIYFNDPATDGVYISYIKDDDTKTLCQDGKDISAVYDLFLTSPAGETVLRQYGTCTIKAAVTREETP